MDQAIVDRLTPRAGQDHHGNVDRAGAQLASRLVGLGHDELKGHVRVPRPESGQCPGYQRRSCGRESSEAEPAGTAGLAERPGPSWTSFA